MQIVEKNQKTLLQNESFRQTFAPMLLFVNGAFEDDKPLLSKDVQEMYGKCNLVFSQYLQ